MESNFIPDELKDAWLAMPKHAIDEIIKCKHDFIIDKPAFTELEIVRYRMLGRIPRRDFTVTLYMFLYSEVLKSPVYILKYSKVVKNAHDHRKS